MGRCIQPGDHRGDAWILTTCILLHSGVGLLQGVRGGGALRCRGAKGAEVSDAYPNQLLSHHTPGDEAVAALPPQPLWSLSWGRASEAGTLKGDSPFLSLGPLVGWKAVSPGWGMQPAAGLGQG